MRIAFLATIFAVLGFAQAKDNEERDIPTLTRFVAPAYPREAKDARISGKTTARITVNREGIVKNVTMIVAHRVFAKEVLEALTQWRFKHSDQEHTFQINCIFELEVQPCEGLKTRAHTSETRVSAELPTVVHIKTDSPCPMSRD
jgi:TonB family protein